MHKIVEARKGRGKQLLGDICHELLHVEKGWRGAGLALKTGFKVDNEGAVGFLAAGGAIAGMIKSKLRLQHPELLKFFK